MSLSRRTALKLAGAGGGAAALGLRTAGAADAAMLSVWTGYPELVPWYQAVGEAYTKARGTKVTVLSTTLREHEQKLSAALPTGTGPDLFDVGLILSVTFIDAGLVKVNPAPVDAQLRGGLYKEASVKEFTIDGRTHGLPLLFSTPAMFWNKAMFREAGIAGPPDTYPQLMEYAKKLTRIDSTGKMTRSGISLRLSGQGSGIAEKFRFVLEPAGGSLIVGNGKGKYHQGYDNDAGRAALKFYIDAVQVEHVDDPRVQHDADAFVAGNTAMLFREAWVIGEIQKKSPSLEYDVYPIPAWTAGGKKKTLLQHDGLYVSAKSRNYDAATDFMLFLTTKEASLQLTTMSGWVAARQDVDWSPLLARIPQYQNFVSMPKEVELYPEPVLTCWNEIESRLADQLPAAYVDPSLRNDPKKLADTVHKWAMQTDQILKDNDLYGA